MHCSMEQFGKPTSAGKAQIKQVSFKRNLLAAFSAQGISLLLSVMMSLVIPRYLGVEQYSWWQLFIFFAGYVGFFHFGFNDGLYLRLGGQKIEELDGHLYAREFQIFLLAECLLALIGCLCASLWFAGLERQLIFQAACIYMVLNNAVLYFGYIFQAVNDTRIYSYGVILDRIFVLIFMAVLLLGHVDSFFPYVLSYMASKAAALVYSLYKGRQFLHTGNYPVAQALSDMWVSTKCGISLTLANIASMLILGIGRIVIDGAWGIETFGRISLSLTITNFFLLFIQQTAMVMFPALRRIDEEHLRSLFEKLSAALDILLPVILVAYVPIKSILSLWLPQYAQSLNSLALLLPICIFDGRMQLLYSTYFKVLRKEKTLFAVNVLAMAVSFALCWLMGYGLHSLEGVVLSMCGAIALRSMLSMLLVCKYLQLRPESSAWLELGYVVLFMAAAWFLPGWMAFVIIVLAYAGYLLLCPRQRELFQSMLRGALSSRWKRALR